MDDPASNLLFFFAGELPAEPETWLSILIKVAAVIILVGVNGFFDASVPIDLDRVFPSFGELLNSFAAAGLVLLVSWIMDVGLYEKQQAEALRRDADLVI